MGGGASSQKLQEVDEKLGAAPEKNAEQSDQMNTAVEEFAEQCYLDGSKPDGLKLILTNPKGRKAFIKFLNTENGPENMKFFEEMDNMRKVKEASDSDIAKQAQEIVDTYAKPKPNPETEADPAEDSGPAPPVDHVAKSINEIKSDDAPATTPAASGERFLMDLNSIEKASNETMVFMAFNVFPNFIGSQAYKDWRKEEAGIAEGVEPSTAPTTAAAPAVVPEDSLAAGTVQYIEPSRVSTIFRYGSWLGAYVAAAEGLPICVTLADASPKYPGFPLIYVNKVFEDTTLFPRDRIRNTNCKFLQGRKSEKESIALLSNALANAQPVKVAITNYRHDGTMFKNLLAMKPVFDLDGKYCYVCGVQFDISNPGSNAKAMKLVDSLINLLPNVVPVGGH